MKVFLSLICVICIAAAAYAAEADSTQGKSVSSYSNSDNMSLGQAREYDRYLGRVLSALNGLDPTMRAELPEWSVNDRELKRRIISAMQKNPEYRARIDQTADIVVTQNPRTRELLRVAVGPVTLHSRQEIEAELGPPVYDKLKEANYDKLTRVNPAEERKNYTIDFTFFRAHIGFEKSGFAFEWYNGKEEIGYPFWLNGTMTLGAAFVRDNVIARLGVDLAPSDYGTSDASILGKFTFHSRKLEGAGGAVGSLTIKNFGLDPADGTLGATGMFTYSFGIDENNGYTLNPNSAYNTSLIALAYATYNFAPNSSMAGFSFSLGGGGHRIDHLTRSLLPKTETKVESRVTLGDVFARASYDHVGEDKYGFALQYSNLALISGYYEFIQGFGLEARYALRMNKRNATWEYDSYFILSPRFSIVL